MHLLMKKMFIFDMNGYYLDLQLSLDSFQSLDDVTNTSTQHPVIYELNIIVMVQFSSVQFSSV